MNEAVQNQGVWDLIAQSGPVVQLVMLSLLAASIISWAIIFDKWRRYRHISRSEMDFEEQFWSGGSMPELFRTAGDAWPDCPMVTAFTTGYQEWRRWEVQGKDAESASVAEMGDLLANVRRAMSVAMDREIDQLERGLNFLATVGSTSPFIGLFGTVWGIMNAFLGLAGAKSTTLAMVAPGIAEALIATAMGLVAAIPAVIAYNKFSSDLRRIHQKSDNFGAEFLNILERRTAIVRQKARRRETI
ncbi:MAG: protein TolQ [Magnetococcales bacterium]|nr:protein TolQ [Magnetococcales bacterium]